MASWPNRTQLRNRYESSAAAATINPPQTTLWQIPSRGQDTATVHGTQKPVECMRRPIVNNSEKGHAVYEPFAGSGTTIIAAETVARRCLAMEIDPRYCDVVVDRWQKFVGEPAVLDEGEERTFDDMKAARLGTDATEEDAA